MLSTSVVFGCNRATDTSANAPRLGPTADVPVGGPNPLEPGNERPENPTCIAPLRPTAEIELVRVFENLALSAPVGMVQAPRVAGEPSGRWFLIEQAGRVVSFFAEPDGTASDVVATDMTSRVHTGPNLDERGLLGIALHPNYPEDARVFLVFNTNTQGLADQLSSFTVDNGAIELASEVPLLTVEQPYTNHNGGGLVFGPDGYLYLGLGDGGDADDPHGHGQNTNTLLGSMLRLDIDAAGDTPYEIPEDNPFVAGGGRPEIFAYGLRNPWRFSFDRDTGQLWLGDVGQNDWEEVDIIEHGGNYGWNVWEGEVCFQSQSCSSDGFHPPVHVYSNPPASNYRSVTGGYVYRGSDLPALVGSYIFADFSTGEIWRLDPDNDAAVTRIVSSGFNIPSFAEDQQGEVYIIDYGGRVFRLQNGEGNGENTIVPVLSLSGCVNPDDPSEISSAAIPYEVAVPFWSDGVDKERYLALPDEARLSVGADGDIELPPGGVSIKNFRHQGRLIETRFYVRHEDGEYSGYSYAWRDNGSDADLVTETTRKSFGDLEWIYPGPSDCNQCHTSAAGRSLGLELQQLDIQNSAVDVNQLEAFQRLALLDASESRNVLSTTADTPLEQRVRAYLHVNCSNCHRPGGPGRGGLDLRYDTQLSATGLCGSASLGSLGTAGSLIAPGAREQSVVYLRTTSRGDEAMPPLASGLVDEAGAQMLGEWIDGLSMCE